MPTRLNRSLEDYRAKEARERAQSALRSRNYRARTRDAARGTRDGTPVTVTEGAPSGGRHAHPPTPPVSALSLYERKKIEHLLAGFAPRGYKHDPRFWELMRQRHPRLDLELEVMKLAEWLDAPKNAKRKCSKAFVANWMQRADADRQQREAQARQAPPVAHGMPYQTPSPGKPPDPEPVFPVDAVLERIDPRVAERALLEAKRLTLPEKLALARNGRHG